MNISAYEVRKIILEQSKKARAGHIGSALSVADLITALYAGILRIPAPEDPDRDRFILSKGHAALALYAALFLRGWISEAELNSYGEDGSLLGVHPEHEQRGVDFSTGSLGHGLSMGAGAALAARLQGSARRTFVLLSDAECNEGSVWEAVMFAAHHRLASLVAIVDLNGRQALGDTDKILSLAPLAERWRAFGWDVYEVDGHNIGAITALITDLEMRSGRPHAVIAHTVLGKGVSYMEGNLKWHYTSMNDEEYRQALADIGAG